MKKPFSNILPIDSVGNITIPKSVCEILKWRKDDWLEIYIDGQTIGLKKFEPGCIFCGTLNGCVTYKNKKICPHCAEYFHSV